MPCVGFEPTIPASERAKTVHALDRSATVTGSLTEMSTRNLPVGKGRPPRKADNLTTICEPTV
jgi:hypothetical protein